MLSINSKNITEYFNGLSFVYSNILFKFEWAITLDYKYRYDEELAGSVSGNNCF